MSKKAKKIIKLSKKEPTTKRIEKIGRLAKEIMDKKIKKHGGQLLPESKGSEMTELEQYIEKMVAEGFSDAEIAHMIELDEGLSKAWHTQIKPRLKAAKEGMIGAAVGAASVGIPGMAPIGAAAMHSKKAAVLTGVAIGSAAVTGAAISARHYYNKALGPAKTQGKLDYEKKTIKASTEIDDNIIQEISLDKETKNEIKALAAARREGRPTGVASAFKKLTKKKYLSGKELKKEETEIEESKLHTAMVVGGSLAAAAALGKMATLPKEQTRLKPPTTVEKTEKPSNKKIKRHPKFGNTYEETKLEEGIVKKVIRFADAISGNKEKRVTKKLQTNFINATKKYGNASKAATAAGQKATNTAIGGGIFIKGAENQLKKAHIKKRAGKPLTDAEKFALNTMNDITRKHRELTQDKIAKTAALKKASRAMDITHDRMHNLSDNPRANRYLGNKPKVRTEEVELEEQRAGKVKLTPGKKMTSAQFKKAKLEAAAKKKAKEAPKKEAPKEQQETTGLDKILSSHDNRTIQQIKNIMKSIKSPDHRDAVMKSLVNNPSKSNVMALIRDPIEFAKSTTAKAKKGQPSLSKLKFMGENP